MKGGSASQGGRYHHGDLRRAVLVAAVEEIEAAGPTALSLREVARRAGVSHAAPRYHFGDKTGVLTAIAAEGYRLLAARMLEGWRRRHSFPDIGVAYVEFARTHRGYFEVMFRPDLYRADDADLAAARREASDVLLDGARDALAGKDADAAAVATSAWALGHGLATLWLNGNLEGGFEMDPTELAWRVIRSLPDLADVSRESDRPPERRRSP